METAALMLVRRFTSTVLFCEQRRVTTGSFKDATATIIFSGKSQNQNYDIAKNVSLLII